MTKKYVLFLALAFVLLFGCFSSNVDAAAPVKHSTQKVELQIVQGRIFFHPNTVTCTLQQHPCFEFQYVGGNYGPRPLFLDHQTKIILLHGQILPQTFTTATVHYYYLFQNSNWFKVKVIVNI